MVEFYINTFKQRFCANLFINSSLEFFIIIFLVTFFPSLSLFLARSFSFSFTISRGISWLDKNTDKLHVIGTARRIEKYGEWKLFRELKFR